MRIREDVRISLVDGLFRPGTSLSGVPLMEKVRDIPLGGSANTTMFWSVRVALIRSLAAFGPHSQQAFQILRELDSSAFALKFNADARPLWGDVVNAVRRIDVSDDEIRGFHEGLLRGCIGVNGDEVTQRSITKLCNLLMLGGVAQDKLLDGVNIASNQTEESVEPKSRSEKRIWENFEALQKLDSRIQSLADLIKPGFQEQGEQTIDGSQITVEIFRTSKEKAWDRYTTASQERKLATKITDDLKKIEDISDTVRRHTRGLMQVNEAGDVQVREVLKLSEGAYVTRKKRGIPEFVPASVNATNFLMPMQNEPAEKSRTSTVVAQKDGLPLDSFSTIAYSALAGVLILISLLVLLL